MSFGYLARYEPKLFKMLFYSIILPLGFLLLFFTFFIVKQQSAAIIERFGKFVSVRQSGLQLKIPIIDNVAGRLSLKIQQLDVVVETKTKDDEHEANQCARKLPAIFRPSLALLPSKEINNVCLSKPNIMVTICTRKSC